MYVVHDFQYLGYFVLTSKSHTFLIVSGSFFLRTRTVSEKSCSENQNTHFMFSSFLIRNLSFFWDMWKNIVQWAGHRWQYGACALHAGYQRLQIHTLRLCNTHCFPTVTMDTRTRLSVTLCVHCLSCSNLTPSCIKVPNTHGPFCPTPTVALVKSRLWPNSDLNWSAWIRWLNFHFRLTAKVFLFLEFELYVVAADRNGKGNSATATLLITVLDVNDHAPSFPRTDYEFVLTKDLTGLTTPALITVR